MKKHLVRLFPELEEKISKDTTADYHWRLTISKQELAAKMTDYILHHLEYDNFKAAQEKDDPAWSRFLHAVWGEGFKLQK